MTNDNQDKIDARLARLKNKSAATPRNVKAYALPLATLGLGIGIGVYAMVPHQQDGMRAGTLPTSSVTEFQSEGGLDGFTFAGTGKTPADPPPAQAAQTDPAVAELTDRIEAMQAENRDTMGKMQAQLDAAKADAAEKERALSEAEAERARLEGELLNGTSLGLPDQAAAEVEAQRLADLERRRQEAEAQRQAQINSPMVAFRASEGGEGDGGKGTMPPGDDPSDFLRAGAHSAEATRAEMIAHPGQTIPQGTMIEAALETSVDSSLPGNVAAIVSQDVWWTAAVRWADIVLPASSTLERDDISVGGTYSNDKIYAMKKVIEPLGESMSDYEIFEALADRMGLWAQFTDSVDYMDHIRAAYERTGASKTTPFEEFWEKGYALQPAPPEARKWVRHGAFYEDPEANPLHTLSGKIEMFCSSIADMNVADNPGMPVWQEPLEYLGNAKEGQLHIVSPHPWYRLHSQMDNSARLRELYKIDGREPVRINRQDAEARGIADGDLVEIRNERGAIIAGAVLSDDIMPGVMSLYEGVWPDLDSKGRCNSGQINWITSERPASGLTQATIANTCVASVAKCEDAERPNQAHKKPPILTDYQFAAVDESELGLDRVAGLVEALYENMEPGERIFYQRCTVCHGPRDPGGFTQLQWRGITPSMFPRAGLDADEAALVTDFLMRNASDAATAVN